MKNVKVAVAFLLWLNCCFESTGRNMNKLQVLKKYGAVMETLIDPERYYKYCRPDLDLGSPVEVNVTLDVASIEKISDDDMAFTVTFTLFQQWRDSRLDATKLLRRYSQVLTMDASSMSERIWIPDTYIVNSQSSTIHDVTTKNGLIRMHPDGTVSYVLRITSQISCPMDFRNYPMDEQVCSLQLESWSFPDSQLTYRWQEEETCGSSVAGMDKVLLSHFNITKCRPFSTSHDSMRGNFSRLAVEFHLKRNLGIFLMLNYIPSACLVVLSWISLWINKNAVPARFGFSATTVLAMTNIMIGVYNKGPRSSSYVKAGDIYVCVCNILVFAALLEYAIVHFASMISSKHNIDHDLLPELLKEKINASYDDKEKCVQPKIEQEKELSTQSKDIKKNREAEQLQEEVLISQRVLEKMSNIDKYARIIHPLVFMTFNIFYWWYYLGKESPEIFPSSSHQH